MYQDQPALRRIPADAMRKREELDVGATDDAVVSGAEHAAQVTRLPLMVQRARMVDLLSAEALPVLVVDQTLDVIS